MPRPSRLIYRDSRTELVHSQSLDGDLLFEGEEGIPVLWILAFGGRNIWNPGDDVIARGGVVGKRNPYETMVEVALARLDNAEQVMRDDPYLWPFMGGLAMFRRKLTLKAETGFIRIVAPWLVSLRDDEIDRWRAATAFGENAINFISTGRKAEAIAALKELAPFCQFVPLGDGEDRKRLGALKMYANEPEPVRATLLSLGKPDNRDVFDKAIARDVTPAFEALGSLPPLKIAAIANKVTSVPVTAAPKNNGTAEAAAPKQGLLSKLTGLFKKGK